MKVVIDSGIHLVATFPMSARDPEFVMAVAKHFDPESKSLKDESGKKLIRLDEEFFDSVFKCPSIERFSDITMQSVVAYFDKNSDKCRRIINDNWLKTPRPTIARWLETLPRCDFIEEINELITLLSRVKGLPTSNNFHKWMYQYIHVIR